VKAYEKIFRLACFNVFAHNRDDHSKNFSFLMNKMGEWRFAPAYDLTFSYSSHGHHSNAIVLDDLAPGIKPIVRIIDDWVTSRSLAMFFEVKIGKGKMVVSGVDFLENQEKRMESKQLMYSLLSYMNGPDFNPEIEMPLEEISKIFN